MSELKLVSPLLDGFILGNPMREHDGIRCCPAIKENTDEKYIVKIISVPASQVQLDALLLTGAHKDPAEAMDYFKSVADSIESEIETLNTLAKLEGFLPCEGLQIVPMEEGRLGYEIYLLSPYRRSLLRHMQKKPITYLDAVNLGLDLCAALAICRRAGFLYVDLKPSNIFRSREKQYRIGDLGFVSLDSLSYTSLPGKYRSRYSPPELQDDMKVLNETVDTYAVGMILYQIYNEGKLPDIPLEPKNPFPHPANADYEIASIIMKALDPDPANRWTNPMEMGQALVGYMQRNTVNNLPIAPPSGIYVHTEEPAIVSTTAENSVCPEPSEETTSESPQQEPVPEVPETSQVSDSPMASAPENEPDANKEEEDDDNLDFSIAFSEPEPDEKPEPAAAIPAARKTAPVRKKRSGNLKAVLSAILVLLILVCVACGGFWYYQTIYLQTIDSLVLDGTQHELTVTIETDMNTDLLQVICTDSYGNSITQPVVNGQAVFTGLLPDSLYRVELSVDGFHALTGKTAEIFTTDAVPTIISMSTVTGAEDGSVMVNFTVDGSDPEEWIITCSADGEEDINQAFTGHSVTVKGLTVGKVYTLTLGTPQADQILGNYYMDYFATPIVLAENLTIADYENNTMTVRWDAPNNVSVDKWTVRCYNDEGHEETLEIAGTEIAFTGIDSTKSYTVEVTAAGMTQTNRVSISANPLKITGLSVNTDTPGQLTVDWTYDGAAPESGWLLMYTIDSQNDQPNVVKCSEASAVIETRIPNAAYHIEVHAADSTSVFNHQHSFISPAAGIFTNESLSADNITSHLLKTPDQEDWTIDAIGEDAYTDTFQSGDSISVVLTAGTDFYLPEMEINVMYVIRDGDGNVLLKYLSKETHDWKDLWFAADYHKAELTIPEVPTDPGSYSVSIYFNDLAVTATNFTIAG